jgi:hypothetical protein
MLRQVLTVFDMDFAIEKQDVAVKDPVLTINRSDNAFIFSGYNPNSTVKQHFKFAQGAPLLLGLETVLENGYSTYTMPTAWHRECRVFVEQTSGLLSYKELHSGQKGISKRYMISGLESAQVRIYPSDHIDAESLNVYLNSGYPWKKGQIPFEKGVDFKGTYFEVKNVTGSLVFSW